MLTFFVRIMDFGIALSLILPVIFAIFRTQNPDKKNIVIIISIITGILLGIVSTILRSIPNLVNDARFAFWSVIPVVVSMTCFLLCILFKKLFSKEAVYENIFSGVIFFCAVSSIFYYLPPILLLAQTFVYYGESAVSTLVLFRVIGFTIGLMVMILTSLGIYKTFIRLTPFELRMTVIGSSLILGITQIIIIIRRLYFLRIIPKNNIVFWLISTVINNNRYFIFAMIAFIGIAPVILYLKNIKITEPYENKAVLRKLKSIKRNARRWSVFLISFLIISVLSLTLVRYYANRVIPLSDPEDYTISDGMAVIPLSLLEDNHLHRFEYKTEDGVAVRFIVIKKSEGAYGVALDACDLCGPSGYFERGDDVVCKLCDVVMNRGTIGFSGGCNPVPIKYLVHDQKIKIMLTELSSQAYRFQ